MPAAQTRLDLNKSQMRTIIKRSPHILTLSIEENLEPTIDTIQPILELSDKELTKIIVKSPDVLQYNMSTESITQRCHFYENYSTCKRVISKAFENT